MLSGRMVVGEAMGRVLGNEAQKSLSSPYGLTHSARRVSFCGKRPFPAAFWEEGRKNSSKRGLSL